MRFRVEYMEATRRVAWVEGTSEADVRRRFKALDEDLVEDLDDSIELDNGPMKLLSVQMKTRPVQGAGNGT